MHPHLHLPHLPPAHLQLPTALLSVVYAAAIAVALANPGLPTLGGLVVLAGLTARWALRHRQRTAVVPLAVVPEPAVLTTEPAPAAAA